MPLDETRRLLDFVDHPQSDCGGIDELIDAQLDRVRTRLQNMQALERQLTALRSRCGAAQHDDGECGILHELVAAAQGKACACHDRPLLDTAPDTSSLAEHP
jgi:hypothetical protein